VIQYRACDDGTPQACATATLYLTTLSKPVPDITPTITALPNIMTGVTNFKITVQITELNQQDTIGLIEVRIPVDSRWTFDGPYNPNLTMVGTVAVNNADWTYSLEGTRHVFRSSATIVAGGFSTFGFDARWDAGPNQGVATITSQIVAGSGGENRINNNVDAEKIDFFIN
jgi:hypothetical protein